MLSSDEHITLCNVRTRSVHYQIHSETREVKLQKGEKEEDKINLDSEKDRRTGVK